MLIFYRPTKLGWGGTITFTCTSAHRSCSVTARSLAFAHIRDATLKMCDVTPGVGFWLGWGGVDYKRSCSLSHTHM